MACLYFSFVDPSYFMISSFSMVSGCLRSLWTLISWGSSAWNGHSGQVSYFFDSWANKCLFMRFVDFYDIWIGQTGHCHLGILISLVRLSPFWSGLNTSEFSASSTSEFSASNTSELSGTSYEMRLGSGSWISHLNVFNVLPDYFEGFNRYSFLYFMRGSGFLVI